MNLRYSGNEMINEEMYGGAYHGHCIMKDIIEEGGQEEWEKGKKIQAGEGRVKN